MQAITDRFGVWPICWCLEEKRLAFSDRADSVPSLNSREVEPQALFDYLYFHMIPAPRTIYRGIQKLEPSTRLRFDGTAVVLEPDVATAVRAASQLGRSANWPSCFAT